jgi:Arc/MetJ-type ribon-helix-helix transcriptional regulator
MSSRIEEPIKKITISIFKRQIKEIDVLIGKGKFVDRSKVIREAVERFINTQE